MKVWVYIRAELIYKNFEFEIWTKEPKETREVYFQWPPEAQEYDAQDLIMKLFENSHKWEGFKRHIRVHY